jgi:hypothetical protein
MGLIYLTGPSHTTADSPFYSSGLDGAKNWACQGAGLPARPFTDHLGGLWWGFMGSGVRVMYLVHSPVGWTSRNSHHLPRWE